MEVEFAIAKIRKYASSTSGDTVEVIERPKGGISVVLADGQSSGKGAKWVSSFIVRNVLSLLAQGVRDGAAARAASDSLFTERQGRVSATLNIISIDSQTDTLVITRNNPAPAYLAVGDQIKVLNDDSEPVGLYRNTRPSISEIPLQPGIKLIVFTDGLIHAGKRIGEPMDIASCFHALLDDDAQQSPQSISDNLLNHAIQLDQNRPADDMSLIALQISSTNHDSIRRMSIRLPLGYY